MNNQFFVVSLMNRLAFYLMFLTGLFMITKPVLATKASIIHPISEPNLSRTDELILRHSDLEFDSNLGHSQLLSYSFPTFNSSILDQQLQRYLQYLEVAGPPDILIVGSSRAFQGVDPVALRNALASQGKPNLKIFNFGINGATAQVVELLLRDILKSEQLPKMIVWADGVRAFNSGRVDRTYHSILSSPGYQKIATGSRPNPTTIPATPNPTNPPPTPPPTRLPSRGGFRIDPINFRPDVPAKNYNVAIKNQPNTPILVATNDLENLAFNEPFLLSQYHRSTPDTIPNKSPSSDTLNEPINNPVALGFNPVSNQFNPNTYYQQYKRIAGQYDGDYAAFSLEGKQLTALLAVVDFTKAKRIPLLVVNLPLTNDYLDSVRFDYEQQFRQFMWRTAGQNNFMFRDLSGRWLNQHDYFADPSHLNRFGAAAVSQQLAQDQTIPWPNAR